MLLVSAIPNINTNYCSCNIITTHVHDNKQDRIEILSLASLTLDSQARAHRL